MGTATAISLNFSTDLEMSKPQIDALKEKGINAPEITIACDNDECRVTLYEKRGINDFKIIDKYYTGCLKHNLTNVTQCIEEGRINHTEEEINQMANDWKDWRLTDIADTELGRKEFIPIETVTDVVVIKEET